jgi:carboxyl-terminal processing protease
MNKTVYALALLLVLTSSCKIIYTGGFQPASVTKNNPASLPEKTFEVFWQTFEDHYAFFELHNMDWHASYRQYRPQVNANTSDDRLFSILCQMVKPFRDEHVTIGIPPRSVSNYLIHGLTEYMSPKPSRFLQEFPDAAAHKKFWNMVDQSLVRHGFDKVKAVGPKEDGEPLFHYSRTKEIGYIRFTRCNASPKTEGDEKKDAAVAAAVFDSMLDTMRDTKRMIIDIRLNEGGNDEFSFALANRFTNKKVLGYRKQSRKGGYDEFGPLTDWYLEPVENPYTNPVTVLTNDQACSAADVFALIMKALPNTTLVGENTMGIFSDMYGFQLPNGWYASLSNERYYSGEMKCYEGVGVPVNVEIRNTKDDLMKRKDPVLEHVVNSLE